MMQVFVSTDCFGYSGIAHLNSEKWPDIDKFLSF